MFDLFQYSFIIRGLIAGVIIGLIAPLIGIFLVLRRYSLIADTLAHVSLAGVAIGLLLKTNPVITAILTTTISSVFIEKLRLSKRVYGESALSIFLSGSLALALVLISLAHGFNTNLFSFLFGSLVTVRQTDVWIVGLLSFIVAVLVTLFYKELLYISFDEQSAQVSGIPVKTINIIFIVLAAITISLAIPIVGILLVAALIVIPVVTALQFQKGFLKSIFLAELFSVSSVVFGVIVSYYLNLSPGGTIVLFALGFFTLSFVTNSVHHRS